VIVRPLSSLLIANRGEIATRIAQTAGLLGIRTIVVAPADDLSSGHVLVADSVVELTGVGAGAYLDAEQLVRVAIENGADAVHPGYGFLSESETFAARCEAAGLIWLGPDPETIRRLGDKSRARETAGKLGIPVLSGTSGETSLEEAERFVAELGPEASVMVKALFGGGGRGMKPVHPGDDLAVTFRECSSEALSAFGDGAVYVERYLPSARHIEVQIVGDGTGDVRHLWDRDCSVQRRRQKLVEVAPAIHTPTHLRERMLAYAEEIGREVNYRGVGTVEFLVQDEEIAFLEVNPRIQVEHTITEQVLGIDLVEIQIAIGRGSLLPELDLGWPDGPRGVAIQARVTAEAADTDGRVQPGLGTLERFAVPTGRGIRCDTHAYEGMPIGPRYDSLVAKLIVHALEPSLERAARRLSQALEEFDVAGVPTDIDLLHAIAQHPLFLSGEASTRFVETNLMDLMAHEVPRRRRAHPPGTRPAAESAAEPPPGSHHLIAPISGVIVEIGASPGESLGIQTEIVVIEAMKMQTVVRVERAGLLLELFVQVGDLVRAGQILAAYEASDDVQDEIADGEAADLDSVRPRLDEVLRRKRLASDAGRPEAVTRRHESGMPTARETVAALCDPGSFVEYGALVLPAQRGTRTTEELIERAPADGLVVGVGTIAGHPAAVAAYDYTVMAGTQGVRSHGKLRRVIDLAAERSLPLVMFVEGGGGRPNDTDSAGLTRLDETVFSHLGRLAGRVPVVSVVAGRSFAGNAALAALSDLVIATEGSSLGMAGPAMIEAAGLGGFAPDEVGPAATHALNGVVDVLARDLEEATAMARTCVELFQRRTAAEATADDQRKLRQIVPVNRLRAFDMRRLLEVLVDSGSLIELQRHHAPGMVTALARIEGRSVGLIANDSRVAGGAIDRAAALKAARFIGLIDSFALPMVSLVDTPGFMVGPEAEAEGSVRAYGTLMRAGIQMRSPHVIIVVRKYYGLGAMAMTGGHLKASLQTVAWPSGEFGGMGIEGSVRLAHRRELEGIDDEDARANRFQELVDLLYENGSAASVASVGEIDDVIDPADTRAVIDRILGHLAHTKESGR
jgi:acetyl/propionyl-CoA carboxylase alpha subunit/acetyl-CoA carboxylase carboxyltransferase component